MGEPFWARTQFKSRFLYHIHLGQATGLVYRFFLLDSWSYGPPKVWLLEKDAGYDPPDIFTNIRLTF